MKTPLLNSSNCWCCGTDLLVLGLALCLECEAEFISVIRQEGVALELAPPMPLEPSPTWA